LNEHTDREPGGCEHARDRVTDRGHDDLAVVYVGRCADQVARRQVVVIAEQPLVCCRRGGEETQDHAHSDSSRCRGHHFESIEEYKRCVEVFTAVLSDRT